MPMPKRDIKSNI